MGKKKTITSYDVFRPTYDPNIEIKVTVYPETRKLRGIPVFKDGKVPIDFPERAARKGSYRHEAEREPMTAKLVRRIEKECLPPRPVEKVGEVAGLFAATLDALSEDEKKTLKHHSWSDETFERYFKAFRKRVATKLDKLDPDDLDNGLRNIKTDLVKEANDDARSAGGKITDGNIERLLWVSNTILDSLYRIHPELLRVEFPLERRRGIIAPEQIKALPDLCRVELTRIIMEDMKSTACDSAGVKVSEMAAAMALMFFGGLRTGEAVAPLVRDIVLHDRFAELFIAKRINDKGEMVEVLKTQNAYRLVVYPYTFRSIWDEYLHRLLLEGTWEEIKNRPVLDLHGSSFGKFSSYVKDCILRSGFQEERMRMLESFMLMEPDYVDGQREKEPAAYLLRRDWATRVMDCCDMSSVDTDYRIGHKNSALTQEARDAYLDGRRSEETAKQLERYVFLPERSLHPLFRPAEFAEPCEVELEPAAGCVIQNTSREPMRFQLAFSALETGCRIAVGAPRKPKKWRSKEVEIPLGGRKANPILGEVYTLDYYTKEIENDDN